MITRFLTYCISLIILGACHQQGGRGSLFSKVEPETSGITFNNQITESDSFNVLDYEYLYNGGGVGIGDFNLDGLPDIFFAGNMTSSQLYINKGDWKFEDVTNVAGVATTRWCTGVSVVDINNDNWPDIYVSTAHTLDMGQSANYFFINKGVQDGTVKFEDQADVMGLADPSYSIQATWLDYDLDQDLDLFLINNSMESYPRNAPFGQKADGSGKSTDKLFRNDSIGSDGLPHFTEVSAEAGIQVEGWSLGVMVMDFNDDQYPDIYVANDFLSNDILYLNKGDGTFNNAIANYFKLQSHNSMGIDAADINNDGANDLLILDMLPEDNLRKKTMFGEIPFQRFQLSLTRGYQPQYVRNVLQVNNKDGSFSDIGYFAGLSATDWSWSPLLADFDNDGWRDAYITNGYKKDVTDLDFVDYNSQATAFSTDEEKRLALVTELEKMKGVKKSNFYFKNTRNLSFQDKTDASGLKFNSYSNGAAYVDFDQDGDLDLVVNNLNDAAFLFRNNSREETPDSSHYLRIKLNKDQTAFGAKVSVYADGNQHYAEHYPQRGYLSSVEPVIHFGLGTAEKVDSISIIWPNRSVYQVGAVESNQTLEVSRSEVPIGEPQVFPLKSSAFVQMPSDIIPYRHQERNFDDFRKWPLHFRSYSTTGPVMRTGDLDGDGLDDLVMGGSAGQHAKVYLQNVQGGFTQHELIDSLGMPSEDTGIELFDADQDGDLDIYVARGSSEFYSKPERYQDAFFENDGYGGFIKQPQAVPCMTVAGQAVVSIDVDNDGDLDLFVGGRIQPDQYPGSPRSYVLRNDGGIFKDISAEHPDLMYSGMVTDAVAADIDQNGLTDLILVGEWMPITLLYNRSGTLSKSETSNGLELSQGWWNCIIADDLDKDGDLDFVAGNWGLNNPFSASSDTPVSIYAHDYDKNGDVEAIFTTFIQGKEHPIHARNTLTSVLPGLRSRLSSYRAYGQMTYEEVFEGFSDPEVTVKAYNLASSIIENQGNGSFRIKDLPIPVQMTPIFAIQKVDYNRDGTKDLVLIGNFHGTEVLTGWYDAGNGLLLEGKNGLQFTSVQPAESGFRVPGEGRSLIEFEHVKHGELLLSASVNDSIKIFKRRAAVDPMMKPR